MVLTPPDKEEIPMTQRERMRAAAYATDEEELG